MEREEKRKEDPQKKALGRLLLCDVDGTLLVRGRVSPADAAAVRRWKAAGHAFGLVTGRGEAFCRDLCASMGVTPDVLVTDNGAAVYQEDECVFRSWIDSKEVLAALDRLPSDGREFVPFVTMPDGWHRFPRKRLAPGVMEEMKRIQAHLMYFSDEDLEDLLAREPAVPGLSLYVRKDERTPQVLKEAASVCPGMLWHQTSHDYVEACASDKAEAVQVLLKSADPVSVTYVGDGPNDIPVLEILQDTFVMDTADDEVKKCGARVTESVAAAVERKFEDVS